MTTFSQQGFSLQLIGGEAALTQVQAAALSFYFSIPQLTKSQQGQAQQVAARFRYNRGVTAAQRQAACGKSCAVGVLTTPCRPLTAQPVPATETNLAPLLASFFCCGADMICLSV